MPWYKWDDEYQEWSEKLRSAEDPFEFIEKTLTSSPALDNLEDIRECFASTLQDIADTGTDGEIDKFSLVAGKLLKAGYTDLAEQYSIGAWDRDFRKDPGKILKEFEQEAPELSSDFRLRLLRSFKDASWQPEFIHTHEEWRLTEIRIR